MPIYEYQCLSCGKRTEALQKMGDPPIAACPACGGEVKKLQQQLGQLNYYEGPVDGIMGPQTIAAIKDLQRQAGLPQTGTMNPATETALAHYLAHGNNQMAG